MDFKNIIGHEIIRRNLKNAIMNNHISHSYLFEGPKSIGKETVGKVFAKTLLCEQKGVEPCNRCSSCIQFDKGNNPDFNIVNPKGAYFRKEQLAEVQKDINIKPYNGYRKIYILNDIDKTRPQTQNSFLKTLEEPPGYAIIIMTTTNKYKLVPTIMSRCQIIKFSNVESSKVENALINNYEKTQEEANFLSVFSNGIVGKAIELSNDEEFKQLRQQTISAVDTALNGDRVRIFSTSEFFEKNKKDIEEILDIILLWFRDVLIYKETNNEKYIVNSDQINLIKNHSDQLYTDKINDIIETLINTKESINSKVNFGLTIEMMLLKIQEEKIW